MVTSPVPVDPFLLLMLHAMSSRFYKRGWDEERVATVRPGHCVFTRGVCVCVFLECCTVRDKEGEARLYLG